MEVFARGADAGFGTSGKRPRTEAGATGLLPEDQLAVKSNLDGRLDVFARGSDKAVWHNPQVAPNSGWSGWASMGGWIDIIDVEQNAL